MGSLPTSLENQPEEAGGAGFSIRICLCSSASRLASKCADQMCIKDGSRNCYEEK